MSAYFGDLVYEKADGEKHGSYWFRVKGQTAERLAKVCQEPGMIEVVRVIFDIDDEQMSVQRRFFPCYYDIIPYDLRNDSVYQMVRDAALNIFRRK